MDSIITILFTSPLPVALVILGVACIGIAIVGQIPPINIQGVRAIGLAVFGAILIMSAIGSAWLISFAPKQAEESAKGNIPTNVLEVANGKIVTASGFYSGSPSYFFAPKAILDHQTDELDCTLGTESGNSYWLLPDRQRGWIQVDLGSPYSVVKLRWLNTHNGLCGDRATTAFRIALSSTGQFVGEENIIDSGTIPFSSSPAFQETTLSQSVQAQYIRFYVDDYYNWGGGLNELEVYAAIATP